MLDSIIQIIFKECHFKRSYHRGRAYPQTQMIPNGKHLSMQICERIRRYTLLKNYLVHHGQR